MGIALLVQTSFAKAWERCATVAVALLQCADVSSALLTVTNQDTGRLRDWATCRVIDDANKTVTTGRTLVFMGDSITDFWHSHDSVDSFPARIMSIAASAHRRRLRC
jgi:hypothetical protein